MSENYPIIDVSPLEHSRKRITFDNASANNVRRPSSPSGGTNADRARPTPQGFAGAQGAAGNAGQSRAWSPLSALGGVAQVVAGAGLIALGVPMLILPGPGLLVIGAGALLVARGWSNMRGSRT